MHIRILAFLLFFQSLAACQQVQEMALSSAANIVPPSVESHQQYPENAPPSATNLVFRSTDGGQTWQDVSAGLPEYVQVGPIFADGGEVFLGSENGLYRFSPASTALMWTNEVLLDKNITEIFPGRAGPYVCSYGNGFFQKIRGTGIWTPLHITLKNKTVRTVLETPDGAVLVGCDQGIFKSVDGGKTWKQVFDEGMVMDLVAVDGVLVGGGFRGILRSTDGGEHWDWVLTEEGAALKTGLIEGGVAAITYDGLTKRLRTSKDSGKTWQHMDENLPPIRFSCDIKQAGKYLFYSDDAGISRSSDQGKTWELVRPSTSKQVFDLVVSGQTIFAVRLQGC